MKNIEIISLEISATPGASIGDCMREGIELAAKEWKNVNLRHNGKTYAILVNDLIVSIKEVKP